MADPVRRDDPAAARCPRCGAPNGCAMAAGARDASACWCARTAFAPGALAGLPADAGCVCQRCATAPPAAGGDPAAAARPAH